jgi:hypothetical protein
MSAPWNGNIAVCRKIEGLISVLVEKTVFDGKKQPMHRIVGGKQKAVDFNPLKTALRELSEEAGLVMPEDAEIIFNMKIPVSVEHFQEFYGVWFESCVGILKVLPVRNEELKAFQSVEWMTLEDCKVRLHGNHKVIAKKLEEVLSKTPACT